MRIFIFIGFSFFTLGAALFLWESSKDSFYLNDVEIELSHSEDLSSQYFLDRKNILGESLRAYVGQPLWGVSLSEMRKSLGDQKWIKNFQVSRVFPGKVSVFIDAESIVALWATTENTLLPITEQGKILEPIEIHMSPDVPILRSKQFTDSEEDILAFLELLNALEFSPVLGFMQIREISFRRENGFSLELFGGDLRVELGFPPYSTKVQRVEKVVEYLDRKQMRGRVIDATFSKKVLVRLRKGSYAN